MPAATWEFIRIVASAQATAHRRTESLVRTSRFIDTDLSVIASWRSARRHRQFRDVVGVLADRDIRIGEILRGATPTRLTLRRQCARYQTVTKISTRIN
jgi:hypothetical protein